MEAGTPESVSEVAEPGVTVIVGVVPVIATLEIVAPSVVSPARSPVKLAVYTPVLLEVSVLKVPVPALEVEVKITNPIAGNSAGPVLSKESLAVRVTAMAAPEATVVLAAVIVVRARS